MRLKRIEAKNYLSKSNLPAYDYVINPYVGCTHGCMYCYASFMKKYTNHPEPWGTFLDIKNCLTPLNIHKITHSKIFMSSVTDCYNPYEVRYKKTRSILKQLIGIDCTLTITTKSKLVLRDLDLLRQLKDVSVAISINTVDESFKRDMDKASSIQDRMQTLKILHENGIATTLFMSPIFIHISDWKAIIEATKEYVDCYWVEDLNLRGPYKRDVLAYIQRKYPWYYQEYRSIYIDGNRQPLDTLVKEILEYCRIRNIRVNDYFHHNNRKP